MPFQRSTKAAIDGAAEELWWADVTCPEHVPVAFFV